MSACVLCQLWFHRSTDTGTQYDWVYVYLLLFHTKDFGQHRSNLHFTAAPLGNLLATWPLVCRSMSDTYTLTWWTDFDFDAINRLKWISSVSSQQVLVLVSMNLLFGLGILKSVSIQYDSCTVRENFSGGWGIIAFVKGADAYFRKEFIV